MTEDALAKVRAALAWPAGKALPRGALVPWIGELADLATLRGAGALADLARQVVRDPDSPDQLYDLGYELIEAGLPEIAATVLWHCLSLVGESEEVIVELVSALESALVHADAFALLAEYPALRARSYLSRYLYAYNAAMSGHLDVTRAMLPSLASPAPDAVTLHATIAGLVERADRVAGTCPLDARDLRGWHYVLNGGLLLHQSPYGFDEPMHGRYAWLSDSLPRIATGLDRLATLVRPLGLPCVYTPEGHDNEVVAEAIALRLGIPRAPWPILGVPAPGLVVVYDLAELHSAHAVQLVERRPDQILFAHAARWTADCPIAPDVTTLLYQTLVRPWEESTVIDPDTHEVSRSTPDERSPAEIAAEVAASPGLPEVDLAADQPERLAALVGRAWPLSPGPRCRLWGGGPVPSSRFT